MALRDPHKYGEPYGSYHSDGRYQSGTAVATGGYPQAAGVPVIADGALANVAKRIEIMLEGVRSSVAQLLTTTDRLMGPVPAKTEEYKEFDKASNEVARLHDLVSDGEAIAAALVNVTERLSRL